VVREHGQDRGFAQLVLVQHVAEPYQLGGRVLYGFSEDVARVFEDSHLCGPAARING
jgi:capsule polysaccharide modification protein KpsS